MGKKGISGVADGFEIFLVDHVFTRYYLTEYRGALRHQ